MASSHNPSQENVLKREHSDNILDPNKRTRRILPQVPVTDEEEDRRLNEKTKSNLMKAIHTTTEMDLTRDDLAYILHVSGVRYNLECHSKWWDVNHNNKGELRKLYEDAIRATGGDGVLEAALRQAWSSKDFSEIRNAVFLREPPPLANTENVKLRSVDDSRILVFKAWKAPYQSKCHEYLHDTIQTVKSLRDLSSQTKDGKMPALDYSNTMSIVQSSGSGKSRLVDQLASLIFTIPMNLRNLGDSKSQAFPDPDPKVADFLTVRGNEMTVRTRFHAFFESLFEEVNNWLDTYGDSRTLAALTADWKAYLDDQPQRNSFYSGVISKADEKLEDLKTITALQSAVIERQIPDSFKQLHRYFSPHKPNVEIVLYFDEAHVLCKREDEIADTDSEFTKSNYEIMLSVLNNYVFDPLFVLFLSTASSLSLLAPPPKYAVSSRALRGYHQAPFTEMPFDCAPEFPVDYSKFTLEEVSKPTFLCKFGRPLYWTYLLESNNDKVEVQNLLLLLRTKLLYDYGTQSSFIPSKDGALAVADVRLCLQYEPHVEAYKGKAAELVASHMRTAFSVPFHREYLRSGYPSEPMLAEARAAAQQTNIWREKGVQLPLIDILQYHLTDGLLDRGERGEVIARALVTEAYDRAVEANLSKKAKTRGPVDRICSFSEGCSLLDLMRELFPPNLYALILSSKPANMPKGTGETFEEMFKNAWVRFTHFAKGVDDHLLTQHAMAAAFIRCMAWICRNGEQAVDIIIPVFMGGKIGPETMTAVFIQVKRRAKSGQYVIDAEKTLKFFIAPDSGKKMAYITLVMDLGVQQSVQSRAQRPAVDAIRKLQEASAKGKNTTHYSGTLNESNKDGVRLPRQPERRMSRNYQEPHPRYSIHATGCTDKVYAVISFNDRTKFVDLLRLQQFSSEHPRKEGLEYVEKQKPYFAAGEQSYHWLNCELLNPNSSLAVEDTPGKMQDGVLVSEETDETDEEDEFDEYEDEE